MVQGGGLEGGERLSIWLGWSVAAILTNDACSLVCLALESQHWDAVGSLNACDGAERRKLRGDGGKDARQVLQAVEGRCR